MVAVPWEDVVLTLPPDPGLARLARLATLHFLRGNGVSVMEARRCARTVEERSRVALSEASRSQGKRAEAPLDLVLITGTGVLEAVLRRGPARRATVLVRVPRSSHE